MNKIAQCWSVWVWKSVHLGLRRNGMIHVTYFWESREIEHSAKRQAFTLSHWRIFCYFCLFVFETGSYYPKLSLDLSSNIYPQPVYLSLLSWWDCRCAPPHLARISICRTEVNWGIGIRNKLNTGTLQPRVGAFFNLGSLSVWKFVTVRMILQAFSGHQDLQISQWKELVVCEDIWCVFMAPADQERPHHSHPHPRPGGMLKRAETFASEPRARARSSPPFFYA